MALFSTFLLSNIDSSLQYFLTIDFQPCDETRNLALPPTLRWDTCDETRNLALPQHNLIKLKLEYLKLAVSAKMKDINTDEFFCIAWVWLFRVQLKFGFTIWTLIL